MNRYRFLLAIFCASAAFSALSIYVLSAVVDSRNRDRAAHACSAISARVQVGALRDAFDQAYAIAQGWEERAAFVSMKDGSSVYGQQPLAIADYQSETCQVQGRPDISIQFYFEQPRFINRWAAYTGVFFVALLAFAFLLHLFSLRFVSEVRAALSTGVNQYMGEKKADGFFGRIVQGLVESTPAIRRLKRDKASAVLIGTQNLKYRNEIRSLAESNSQHEKSRKSAGEVAQQFKHDIRSPLALLKTHSLLNQADPKLGDACLLAVKKIENSLSDLDQIDGAVLNQGWNSELAVVECVAHQAVATKRLLWRKEVELNLSFDPKILCLAHVDEGRLARIFDNLLQNSYEAISAFGSVSLVIGRKGDAATVVISDSGRGIPGKVLEHLGTEQITFGKVAGNGVGLLRAKQWVEAWQGALTIVSSEGAGTSITITLPLSPYKALFTADLSRLAGKEVVIVDDDSVSASALLTKIGGNGRHFSSVAAYAKWLNQSELSEDAVSVYDLRLNPGSGLDLLCLHPKPVSALLYTEDYLDREAIQLSERLGFSIYPKVFLSKASEI